VHTRAAIIVASIAQMIEMRINAAATQLLRQSKNTIAALRLSCLLSNFFGREEKNEDNEEALSDELTADFQTGYLHRRYQEHQKETPQERAQRNRSSSEDERPSPSAGERAGVCQPHLGPVYLRVSAACLPNFFKSRSNVSRSFFERTLATSSIAAACSPNPRLISARPLGVSSTWRTRRSSG
jgi:hypothetical protein